MGEKARARAVRAVVALVCLAVLGGLWTVGVAKALENEPCTLTLKKPTTVDGETASLHVEIQADLYYVADWDRSTTFRAVGSFEGLQGVLPTAENSAELSAQKWSDVAEQAAALVEKKGLEPTRSITIGSGKAEAGTQGLNSGLYLLMVPEAHDAVTSFTAQPVLVTLGKGYLSNETTSTDVTAVLKLVQTPRPSSLRIVKTIDRYDATAGEAVFVFDIEAKDQAGKVVYSNVATLLFQGPGTQDVTVQGIPAGSVVTVTEVYSGATYTVQGDGIQTVTAVADGEEGSPVTVEFLNTYSEEDRGGHGVENRFTYEELEDDEAHSGYSWQSSLAGSGQEEAR